MYSFVFRARTAHAPDLGASGLLTSGGIALAVTLAFSTQATAQTWTGTSNGLWNVASNWSSNPALPASGIDTALIFGASSNTTHTQNLLPNPFLLNALTFTSAAPSYTVSGNGLDFRTSSVAVAPRIIQNSTSAITLGVPLTLTSTLTVSGTGNGQVNLSSVLSGAGGLTVGGSGAVSLGSGANTFAGAVNVNSGTLLLGNGAAIPTGRNVTVASGATFNTNGLSNAAGTAIGTVTLNTATLRIPSGSGDYFINRLVMNSGDAVDFTGATSADLHFTGAGAGITLSGSGTLTGGGTSRFLNDTAAPIDIILNGTLSSSVRLANGALGQGFRLTGPGNFMALNNTGNTANLTVDNNVYLQITDMAFLGTGTITLANTTALALPGTLYYTGASASSSKALNLGSGGGQIWVGTTGSNLTLSGVISESVAGQRLIIAGDNQLSSSPGSTLTLTANNSYTGPTVLGYGGVLSIPTIANGGVASPLGASSSAPANLLIGGHPATGAATLQYTGPTATTDRGATLGPSASTIEVTNAATNLTVGGQMIGSGALTKAGPGTLTLTNTTSNYSGGTIVNAGRLSIGANGAVLPSGSAVTVATGGELNLGAFSNASGTALGTVTLNGGVLRVPAGSGNYFVNKLVTETGGALDFSGSTSFDLHFVNAGAGITVNGASTWASSSGSRIVNDTSTTIDLTVAPGVTLTNGISLAGSGYRVTGGGTLYQTTTGSTSLFTVQQARLRVDSAGALGIGALTLDAGILQWSGPTFTVVKSLALSSGGGTVDVSNAATVLTLPSSITGSGALVKAGPGTLVLNNFLNLYSGGITVAAGRLEVQSDDRLGMSNPTVNALGTLRYTSSSSTARTFNLIDGTLEAPTGVTLTLNGATVGGGFLRGSGTFALAGNTALIGVSTASSTTINQTGAAAVTNSSNGGTFTVGGGQILSANFVTNTSSGQMTVNGTANVSDFVSNGLMNIPNGGVLNNTGSPLFLGGGSRTYIGSAAVPGGTIDLGGQTLELNGALLVNDGTVTGTVNVNYGSLVMGTGANGAVNVNIGGSYAPGNSPGISTATALTFDNTPVASGAPTLAIELGGTAPGTQHDQVHVTGNLSLGGTLAVSLIDDFVPVAGQAFDILDWGSLSGTFASLNLPTLAGLTWNTSQLYTNGVLSLAAAGLSGDYNQNGAVDAADYVLWRKNLGSGTSLANDDTPGVGPDDYDRWRAHFGQTTGSGLGATANAAVPEPTTILVLMFGVAGWCLRRRRAA